MLNHKFGKCLVRSGSRTLDLWGFKPKLYFLFLEMSELLEHDKKNRTYDGHEIAVYLAFARIDLLLGGI